MMLPSVALSLHSPISPVCAVMASVGTKCQDNYADEITKRDIQQEQEAFLWTKLVVWMRHTCFSFGGCTHRSCRMQCRGAQQVAWC